MTPVPSGHPAGWNRGSVLKPKRPVFRSDSLARRRMSFGKSGKTGPFRWGHAAILAVLLAPLASSSAFAQYELKARRDYYVGEHPQSLLSVDFDGDGVVDLMSADEISDYISLLKGFGDGSFRRTQTIVAGARPTGIAFVDVNHDNFPDIVASNFLTQDVTVNLGNGQGSFGARIRSLVSATPFGVAVGDWNGDTHVDV